MQLSLVIPAHNEGGSIGRTVTHVCGYLDAQRYDWEVIVVIDDGRPSAAAGEARAAAGQRANVRVLENDVNRGKGFSVRRGFVEARGDRKVFIDADLSLPIEGLDEMMARFDAGADVVIGSRTAAGSRVEGAPPAMRDLMSKVFNLAVQTIVLPGISDTQCGFKGFTAAAANAIFSVAESDRFGFDVEALYLARKHGFRIDELPV
ncbi:MAG TPA: glycosyltransferase, partial [Vicinamibacterales bacterium]